MASIRHPLSQAIYDHDTGSGEVVVVDRNGRSGRFTPDGDWLSGDCRHADPEMCRWVSGPRHVSRHRAAVQEEKQP